MSTFRNLSRQQTTTATSKAHMKSSNCPARSYGIENSVRSEERELEAISRVRQNEAVPGMRSRQKVAAPESLVYVELLDASHSVQCGEPSKRNLQDDGKKR